MNEFLQLLLKRIEEKTSWEKNELKQAILEEYGRMGDIKVLLENALLPAVTDEGRILIIKGALREFK